MSQISLTKTEIPVEFSPQVIAPIALRLNSLSKRIVILIETSNCVVEFVLRQGHVTLGDRGNTEWSCVPINSVFPISYVKVFCLGAKSVQYRHHLTSNKIRSRWNYLFQQNVQIGLIARKRINRTEPVEYLPRLWRPINRKHEANQEIPHRSNTWQVSIDPILFASNRGQSHLSRDIPSCNNNAGGGDNPTYERLPSPEPFDAYWSPKSEPSGQNCGQHQRRKRWQPGKFRFHARSLQRLWHFVERTWP